MQFFCLLSHSPSHYPWAPSFSNSVHLLLGMSPSRSHIHSHAITTDPQVFTAIIAAAVHDVDHRGRTNAFLVRTRHPWATLYNDNSVLENHHVSTAFHIMEDPDCDVLSAFSREQYLVVRKLMIDMVLSTDMARHTKVEHLPLFTRSHFQFFSSSTTTFFLLSFSVGSIRGGWSDDFL